MLLLVFVGAMAHLDPWRPISALLLGGTPIATVSYGLALFTTDVMFRRLGIRNTVMQMLAVTLSSCAILIPTGALLYGWHGVVWWPALIVPGAAIGGLALAHYRNR